MVSTTLFNPAFTFAADSDKLLVITLHSAINTSPGGNQNWDVTAIRYLSPPVPGEAEMFNYTPLWPYAYTGGGRSTGWEEFEANDRTFSESVASFMPMLYNVKKDFEDQIVDNKIVIELSYVGGPDHYEWGYIGHDPQTIGVALYKDTTIEDYEIYQVLETGPIDWDHYDSLFDWHVSEVHTAVQYNLDPEKILFQQIFDAPPRTIGPTKHIIGYLTIDIVANTVEFTTTEPTLDPPDSD